MKQVETIIYKLIKMGWLYRTNAGKNKFKHVKTIIYKLITNTWLYKRQEAKSGDGLSRLLGGDIAGGPAYFVLHPQKGITIAFFLHKLSRNHFPKNSYWGITDLAILISQNNLWTNSLIKVQGDCSYIFFSSFSKLFWWNGNMF